MPVRNLDGGCVRPRGFVLLFLAAFLVSASARSAELAGGTLSVQRSADAADCPDEAALIAATLELGTPPPAAAAPLHLEVSFRHDQAGYIATVQASGRTEGVREVTKEGATCAPLAEAVSVVLAVLLDLTPHDSPLATPAPAPTPTPRPSSSSPTPSSSSTSAPPAPSAERLAFIASLRAGAAYRLVGDGLAPTASASLHSRLDRWELFAGALWAPRGNADYLGHTIEMSLLSAKLGGCAWLRGSRAHGDAALCAAFLAGSLQAQGRGFSQDVPASDPWFAIAAGLGGRLPLARKWALRLDISAIIPTRQQSYTVAFTDGSYETSPLSGLVELGPELTFP